MVMSAFRHRFERTETGHELAFTLSEKCFLVLCMFDGTASTGEIRLWLAGDGDPRSTTSVRCALRGLASRQPPLVAKVQQGQTGQTSSVWQLTEFGRAVLNED